MKNRIFFIADAIMIVLILAFAVNSILSTYIFNKLMVGVPKEKYELSVGSFRLNIFSGSANINSIKLTSKNARIEIINLDRIVVSNVHVLKYLLHNDLEAGSVRLLNGLIRIIKEGKNEKPLTENLKTFLIKKGIGEISINEISLEKVMVDMTTDKKPVFKCSNSDLSIFNTEITRQDPVLKIDSISSTINNMVLLSEDSFYTFRINRFAINSAKKNADVDGIKVIPNYDKKEFSRRRGQTDRFEVAIARLNANDFDLLEYVFGKRLVAGSLNIDSANVFIYRDKYFERHLKKMKLLQQILHDLPFDLSITNCRMKNSKLTYSELNPPARQPGDITLAKIDATIKNVSSSDTGRMILESACLLNNQSRLNSIAKFELNDEKFSLSGNVTDLDMKNFNPLFEPSSKLTITQGMIDSMQFDLKMKDMNINGTVLLLYHNFRVSAIDPETRDTTGMFRNIKTEIANRLVLKSDNHNLFGKPERVEFSRAYNENYFITNNIIQTIITGIKKSVK